MRIPYELLVRWDDRTGAFKGAAVRWADGSIQPIGDGAGGFPLADILGQLQVDALAANESLRTEAAELTERAKSAEQAATTAQGERDAAIADRDRIAAELADLRAQIEAQAAQAALSVPAHHLRRALRDAGLRAQVDALIASLPADHPMREDWEYAPTFRRDAQGIEQVRQALGLTHAQVDDVFRAAAAVRT
jgi:hypothetical protein